MATESVQLMLADASRELPEKAKAAKTDAAHSGSDYDKGRHFALYEAISMLVQQVDALGIDRVAGGLNDVRSGARLALKNQKLLAAEPSPPRVTTPAVMRSRSPIRRLVSVTDGACWSWTITKTRRSHSPCCCG